jgi:hypothetical protein
MNKTSSGLDGTDFFYPAIDTGGLTNYRQKLGQSNRFLPKRFLVDEKNLNINLIDKIYKTWKRYSGKTRFYGNIKQGLTRALHSIKRDCYIQFVKLPIENRVICTSNDVYKTIGKYYTRLYGNSDYAKLVKPRKSMYCGISEKFITPDINRNNILNEYTIC